MKEQYKPRIKAEKEKPKGFDTTVTFRDERTGLVTHTDPYIMRRLSNKSKVFERPAGSGNLFDPKGNPAGRWDKTKPEGERYIKGAAHVAWQAPETEDQRIARMLIERDVKIAELQKELSAIQAEKKNGKGA